MQIIIKWNNNKRGSGFSQVQVIKRREIIYLLCLPVIFCSYIDTFLREEKEEAMLSSLEEEKGEKKKKKRLESNFSSVGIFQV